MNTTHLKTHLRTSVWVVPVLCVLAGVALSFGTIAIDRITNFDLIPRSLTGDADAANAILATVATSEVTLCALVLTVTMVVVQLAMGQFSPRIVQTILQDKPSQIAIGLFVATFAHAMLAMREVNTDDNQVPGLAIVVAFVLVVLSIVVLVVYVDHIGKSLRVSSLIELVGTATRKTLDEQYPDVRTEAPRTRTAQDVVVASHSGVVSHIDRDALIGVARDADVCLELDVALGDFVPAGSPLVRVHGDARAVDGDAVRATVLLSLDRSLDQDVAYGMRMLVDIAERSLADSPFLDPTTAVQSLDRLHDCLRQLGCRPFPSGELVDEDGKTRVVMPVMDWPAYVQLAFEEIRLAGAGSPQVARRLADVLQDLRGAVPPDRRPPLDEQLALLDAAVQEQYADARDVAFALEPDRQGLGRGHSPAAERATG